MKMKHSYRPALEGLESRWVPATIRLVGGNLFVSNQAGSLTVETTGTPGQVRVTDKVGLVENKVVVNGVGALISITGTNKLDTITFDGNALAYPGNLLINALNGNDVLNLAGTVNGNATVLGGLGNDTLTTVTLDAKVGGNLTYTGGLGLNDLKIGANLKVGGNLTATGLNDLDGEGDLTVGGSATLQGTPTGSTPVNVGPDGAVDIAGSLSVLGGTGTDTIDLTAIPGFSVGGNVNFNLRGGNNVVALTPTIGTVGGSLALTTGAGDDVVTFGSTLQINGNAVVTLGEGANLFDTQAGNAVLGSLQLSVGNGDNQAMTLDGDVGGTLAIFQGNGTNAPVTISTVPAYLVYRGGNGGTAAGDNSIVLTGAGTYVVDMTYGTGFGDLTLNNLALVLTGVVRGTPGGSYALNVTAGTLAPDLALINFP